MTRVTWRAVRDPAAKPHLTRSLTHMNESLALSEPTHVDLPAKAAALLAEHGFNGMEFVDDDGRFDVVGAIGTAAGYDVTLWDVYDHTPDSRLGEFSQAHRALLGDLYNKALKSPLPSTPLEVSHGLMRWSGTATLEAALDLLGSPQA